jgi:hypothetical protein
VRIQRINFPKIKLLQINELARLASPRQIVLNKGYIYFVIQNTQEDISLKSLVKTKTIQCYSVLNFRGVIIGYIVRYNKKPFLNVNEFGASIFYSKAKDYKKVKVQFHDQKFRLLSYDTKDFFASVKWKSNNPTE